MLSDLHALSHAETRLIITYYSSLWRPFITLASWLGLREKTPETNWLAHEDIGNLLTLESFELVRWDSKILLPFYIPLLSNLVNRYLAPLPFFRMFSLVNIVVARPLFPNGERPSVSVVVPARNEAGNIQGDRRPHAGDGTGTTRSSSSRAIPATAPSRTCERVRDAYKGSWDIKVLQAGRQGQGRRGAQGLRRGDAATC